MYSSLLLPWSPTTLTTASEHAYRTAGLIRTKGTIFLLPPPINTLRTAYNAPPRAKTRMSAGAVALCKHFERGGGSSEHGRAHLYWTLPRGSNEAKTEMAGEALERMLREAVWRNVMLLHAGVAVYEVRNGRGFGMRWTLEVEEDTREMEGGDVVVDGYGEKRGSEGGDDEELDVPQRTAFDAQDANVRKWRIVRTSFRGFLEPIEGMDHELDSG